MHTSVINRNGIPVTTAVTNMDIHDIARSARTYGLKGYFIVTPITDQHELIGRILGHWQSSRSLTYHPDRVEALSRVRLAWSFDEVKAAIRDAHGCDPEVVLTDARPQANAISYDQYRSELTDNHGLAQPVLIVFGTGWGIAESFYPEVHRILAPVYGPEEPERYNHLSVRAAVAVILDRLLGQ